MWFPLLTLHFIGDQNLLVAMTDGEAWLEALGEQLRESEKQTPALAAAQVKLADADATGVAELQRGCFVYLGQGFEEAGSGTASI